jgi:hypothetical protein
MCAVRQALRAAGVERVTLRGQDNCYSFSEKELDLFTRSSIVPHSSPYQKMCGTMPHLRQKIQIFI